MNENLQLALTLFLIHAAWQGTVIAVLVVAADRVFRDTSSTVRYRLFFLALLFMLLFPALTSLLGVPAVPIPSAMIAQPAPAVEGLPAATSRNAVVSGSEAVWLQAVQVSAQYLVPVWAIGVLAMTLRWTGASYVLRRRIRRSSLAGERWRESVDDLRRALRIERAVRVLQVEWLAAPATVGWLFPILLLPVSALSGLPPQQIEAIIAHELAHIRRNDYLANLVQVAAETLLFFHPAVWWLSAKIRQEREELCDAIAVSQCGDPQLYAHALLAMACGRTAPRLIMAAEGGSLSERVFRILGVPRRGSGVRSGSIGVALALLVAVLTVTATQLQTSPTFEVTSVKPNNLPPRERKIERFCSGGRFVSRGGAVVAEIKWAYQVETFDPLGVPAWAGFRGDRYDIEARASASMTEDQCRLMVQTLLADRFKLKVRWESQETPVYALVVAKGGPKMRKVTESDPANSVLCVLAGTKMQMFDPKLKGWTMEQLSQALVMAGLERTVVDRTRLEGEFKFHLEFRPESLPPERGTDVRTALAKLGLKLEGRQETIKRLIVDHVERPDEN